jgi:hypothetical protein
MGCNIRNLAYPLEGAMVWLNTKAGCIGGMK